jgi:hypothetical protein
VLLEHLEVLQHLEHLLHLEVLLLPELLEDLLYLLQMFLMNQSYH